MKNFLCVIISLNFIIVLLTGCQVASNNVSKDTTNSSMTSNFSDMDENSGLLYKLSGSTDKKEMIQYLEKVLIDIDSFDDWCENDARELVESLSGTDPYFFLAGIYISDCVVLDQTNELEEIFPHIYINMTDKRDSFDENIFIIISAIRELYDFGSSEYEYIASLFDSVCIELTENDYDMSSERYLEWISNCSVQEYLYHYAGNVKKVDEIDDRISESKICIFQKKKDEYIAADDLQSAEKMQELIDNIQREMIQTNTISDNNIIY